MSRCHHGGPMLWKVVGLAQKRAIKLDFETEFQVGNGRRSKLDTFRLHLAFEWRDFSSGILRAKMEGSCGAYGT